MKIFNLFLLVISLFFSLSNYSQQLSTNIGESTANKLLKEKPAEILATFPDNDSVDDSWLINGYLEFKVDSIGDGNYSIGILSEVHKNNLISKEQDVRQIGVSIEKDFILKKQVEDYDGKNVRAIVARLISNASFKRSNNLKDNEKKLISNLGFSLSLERGKNFRFLQTNTRLIPISSNFGKLLTLSHNHNFGISYIGGNDDVLLGDLSFQLNLFPFSGTMYKLINQPEFFQLQYNINWRNEIFGETDRDLNSLETLSMGINYKINQKSSVGIAYNFQKGANPYTELENQSFKTVSAKLRLVIE